ncbi:hypothetical protein EDB89DRAFT_1418262 [Lactarius sanguifluus]|nr:hypothetical protein EDB89DRAFT_1418262 [Lactarius sanguifluus]
MCLRPGESSQFLGPYNSACSVLPLRVPGTTARRPRFGRCTRRFRYGDDRTQRLSLSDTRSHHSATATAVYAQRSPRWTRLGAQQESGVASYRLLLINPPSTGNEIPIRPRLKKDILKIDYLDPRKGSPYASIKIFYRSRELLRAQGIIPGDDESMQGSPINNEKRAREDGSPGPSRSRQNIKRELSEGAREQRIRALQVSQGVVWLRVAPDGTCMQAELDALRAPKQSDTSVKRELRSPSPIVVRHAGEVVDLTLDD